MTAAPDFIAYGADGRALVVEAKVRPGGGNGTAWSTVYRENLIAAGVVPADAWFLLATPETLFLWEPGRPDDAEANWELAGREVFAPYLALAGVEPGARIDSTVFEMIVGYWLRDLRSDDGTATGKDALLDKLRERLHRGLVVRPKSAA